MTSTPEDALRAVESALDAGDLLLAFDLAADHRVRYPECEGIRHKGVLALARAGALERAEALYAEWGLAKSQEPDVLALGARLKKDRAIEAPGDAAAAFRAAADAYGALYKRSADHYLAINWASMLLLAGDVEAARKAAALVLEIPQVARADDYYALATRAEAQLLLGRPDAARESLECAAAAGGSFGHRSTTMRQFRLLMRARGCGEDEIAALVAPLKPAPVIHYTGHMIAGAGRSASFRQGMESAVRGRIAEAVAEIGPSAGFGSLASGADILFAEALLARGAELNVVLPFAAEDFIARSVRPAGESWVARFAACLDHPATRVSIAADDLDIDDPSLFGYGAQVAMGLAILRARHLEGEAIQVALWDGRENHGPAGTHADMTSWTRHARRRQVVLRIESSGETEGPEGPAPPTRPFHAVIFGDIRGFSQLGDARLPDFWDVVMGAVGDELRRWEPVVALRATWGDAIHLVIADVRSAAELCLAVQRRMSAIDATRFAGDSVPMMRIGAHFGPVYRGWDPVIGQHTYYGRVLSRAARVEPIAPPGRIYVTEAFAAILALETGEDYACTYVGKVPLAKGYGEFRMYDLAPRKR